MLAIALVGAAPPAAVSATVVPGAVQVAEGIPVTSDAVREACGACHASDDQGRMSRISYRRATPENWELTIKRMIGLNGVPVTMEQAREVLKYLADNHGLAPEEARPVMFDAERRMVDFTYSGDTETHNLCNACHTVGRVVSERRTSEEWKLLIAMHRGVYPGIDGGSGRFRRGAGGPGAKAPMDLAIEHLSKAFPLMSTEWTEWTATQASPRLGGTWALSGTQRGMGPVYGQVTIEPQDGAADGFMTETTLTYVTSGKTVTLGGRAVVYTGFQWRGRASEAAEAADAWREVAMVSRDQSEISGRWFTGEHAETGIDVTLRRVTPGVLVMGTDVPSLKSGTTGQTVRIYGANFPSSLAPDDVALGAGVTVTGVVSSTPTMATVTVDVAIDARVGPRDVLVAGSLRPAALVVYDKVDGIKVMPTAGMARVGGIVFPKRFEQFEAVAYNAGPDGDAGTDDDLMLGMVDADWSLEEYSATFVEDDLKFVGSISDGGLFTPNVDGTNSERSGNRNNIGDVWVVADYTPPGGTAMRGRAHLLVAPPLYMDWSSTEVGK